MFDFWYHLFFPSAGDIGNGITISTAEEVMMKGVFFFMTLVMVLCATRRGFTDSRLFEDDRYWNGVCIALLDRVEKLIPIHRRHMLIYAKAIQMDIRKKPILDLARSLPRETKIEAERDLCLSDVYSNERMTLLKSQLITLMTKQNKA